MGFNRWCQCCEKDKDINVEYWAIDNVGNEESHHTFNVDLDQTAPSIELNYEIIGGNAIEGWTMEFNATVDDGTSGQESGLKKVEFYLNDVLQDEDSVGPYYTWEWKTPSVSGSAFGEVKEPSSE